MKYIFATLLFLLLATGCFDIFSDKWCEDGVLDASSIPGDYIGTFSYQVGTGALSVGSEVESTVKIEGDSCFVSLKLSSHFDNTSQLEFVFCDSLGKDCGGRFFYIVNNPLFRETTCSDEEGSGYFSLPRRDSVDYDSKIFFRLVTSDPDSSALIIYGGTKL